MRHVSASSTGVADLRLTLAPTGSNSFTISAPRDEFDLDRCVTSGQSFRWKKLAGGDWLGVDGTHWYLARTEADHTHIQSNGTEEAFRRLFRLDWDAAEIRIELLRRGPELEPLLDAAPGLRLMRPSDPVETLFSFLCSPNNHIARIAGMVERLAALGPPLEGSHLRRFPEIEIIADRTEDALREEGFGYRAATIPAVARELAARGGRSYLGQLAATSHQAARVELISLRGVGPKLADCISLFALHHTEATPIDTHIWQAATQFYFPDWQGTPLTDKKYVAVETFLADRFGELAGWAQQCLFYENLIHWRERK